MTVFGWDASDFDWSRGPMNMAAAHADGIEFVSHKATEGSKVRHIHYGDVLNRARDAGVPVLGAYHVVRTAPSIASQIAWFLSNLDKYTPWWRSHPNFFLQVDLERWPYDNVSSDTGCAFAEQLKTVAHHTVLLYASKGQYGNSLSAPDVPLWNADYPSSRSGPYHGLYPGDGGQGWTVYSGRMPAIWQYTSSATIGGQTGCDANAFRGTLADLLTLTGGDDMTPEQAAQLAQTLAIVRAARWGWQTDRAGFSKAGGDLAVWDYAGGMGDNTQAAQVQQLLAAVGAQQTRDQVMLTAIEALAAGGGVDSAPIVSAINTIGQQLHDQLAAETVARQAAEARVAKLEADLAAALSAASTGS